MPALSKEMKGFFKNKKSPHAKYFLVPEPNMTEVG
jgi:hypothetical protein